MRLKIYTKFMSSCIELHWIQYCIVTISYNQTAIFTSIIYKSTSNMCITKLSGASSLATPSSCAFHRLTLSSCHFSVAPSTILTRIKKYCNRDVGIHSNYYWQSQQTIGIFKDLEKWQFLIILSKDNNMFHDVSMKSSIVHERHILILWSGCTPGCKFTSSKLESLFSRLKFLVST